MAQGPGLRGLRRGERGLEGINLSEHLKAPLFYTRLLPADPGVVFPPLRGVVRGFIDGKDVPVEDVRFDGDLPVVGDGSADNATWEPMHRAGRAIVQHIVGKEAAKGALRHCRVWPPDCACWGA